MTTTANTYEFPLPVRLVAASLDLPVHLELEVRTAPLVEGAR